MPTLAIILWSITGGLCFVFGAYFLWRIERSGVGRWGACGRTFGLGTRRTDRSDNGRGKS